MKITNCYNLPKHILELIILPVRPEKGVMRATSLIDAPLVRRLMYERWDDLTVDYSDFLAATAGSIFHKYTESREEHELVKWLRTLCDGPMNFEGFGKEVWDLLYDRSNITMERRLEVEIDGWKVTGATDHYNEETGALRDTKFTKVGYVGLNFDKLTAQMNIYAWLHEKHGKNVTSLTGDIWYKNHDWKVPIFQPDKDYPKICYQEVVCDLWPMEQREQYVKDRLHYHEMAGNDVCTPDERWRTPTTFVAMKKTGGRSLFGSASNPRTKEEVEQWLKDRGKDDAELVERTGGNIRCLYFCELGKSGVCPYFKENTR